MLNETILVDEWLRGENIDRQLEYRMCFLLCKWCLEHNIKNPVHIREFIFDWGHKNNIFFKINLNDCIKECLEDGRRLTNDNPIKVSSQDVHEITKRFDKRNTRLCALAFLCYAKQFANSSSEFKLPFVAFGKWIGIPYNTIENRYLWELEMFGYVQKLEQNNKYNKKRGVNKTPVFRILVPIVNSGEYIINQNNIRELYNKIFA